MEDLKYSLAALIVFVMLFPIYWMIVGSFQPINGIMKQPPSFFPTTFTVGNYTQLLKGQPFMMWLANTAIITSAIVVFSLIASIMAGYAFATNSGKVYNILFWIAIGTIMIPRATLIIPLFTIMKHIGLSGTRLAAIIPLILYPFGIFFVRNYIKQLPKEFIESARIDGASEFRIMLQIIIPVSSPAIATILAMQLIGSLSDYLWQFLVLQEDAKKTLIVGVISKVMQRSAGGSIQINPIGTILAAGVILFIPMLTLFVIFQKYLISGKISGGIVE
jgi:multiple sugar transport system permease protein